jgi:SsrA-binding protein
LRDRKLLLLTKVELRRLAGKIVGTGVTCVPTKVFLSHGFAKIEIAIAKGKQLHDKRDSVKEQRAGPEDDGKFAIPAERTTNDLP